MYILCVKICINLLWGEILYTLKLLNINIFDFTKEIYGLIKNQLNQDISDIELPVDSIRIETLKYSFDILIDKELNTFYINKVSKDLLNLINKKYYTEVTLDEIKNYDRIPIDFYANYDFEMQLFVKTRGF